jgi:D-alanyl-D-alanine carboxypeptidase-like protein
VKRLLGSLGGGIVGVVVGALVTLAIQGSAAPGPPGANDVRPVPVPVTRPAAPATFLAWVPHGLPDGFDDRVSRLPQIARMSVIAEDNVWLRRSWAATGELVDETTRPYRIPIDAAAIDVRSFAPFLPPADRATLAAVEEGEGILGSTSASVRGLGPGAVLDFGAGAPVRIAAVLPDELVGAAELVVSKDTGRRIGVTRDRHLLLQPAAGQRTTSRKLERVLQPLLPHGLGVLGRVQIRASGETPYFRAGDAVLPPVLMKALFGEFAARPAKGDPGYLELDPAWTSEHLVTTTVPLLGRVTCHRAIVPQLRGAMRELRDTGYGSLIRSFHGCFVPRFITRDPTALISHHAWGVAFDVNLVGNYYGQDPRHDQELLADRLAPWGFLWGGDFVVPDGNHFEYRRAPAA